MVYTSTKGICNKLHYTATHCTILLLCLVGLSPRLYTHLQTVFATNCTTLHHTAPRCTTLHHTAPHCTSLQNATPHCNTLQHIATHYLSVVLACRQDYKRIYKLFATHCNTLQHTATHCNTLQHTTLWSCGPVGEITYK